VEQIKGNTVVISRELHADLAIGDRAQVILATRDEKNPQTGQVIKTVIIESVIMKITIVDQDTANCEPVNAVEAAKLKRIKVKMQVKTYRPKPQ
jgi:hypothetical protein